MKVFLSFPARIGAQRLAWKALEKVITVMQMKNEKIDKIIGDYKYGFKTEAKEVFNTGRGLNLDVVFRHIKS